MICFDELNAQELSRCGFSFQNGKDGKLFADIVRECLEIRVGEAIQEAVGIPDDELFCLTDEEEAYNEWLQKNCSNFREIILKKEEELGWELVAWRDRIAGLDRSVPKPASGIRTEDLSLSIRSQNCLRRAGLNTVGAIAAIEDLGKLRGLNRSYAAEINRALMPLIAPDAWEKETDKDSASVIN